MSPKAGNNVYNDIIMSRIVTIDVYDFNMLRTVRRDIYDFNASRTVTSTIYDFNVSHTITNNAQSFITEQATPCLKTTFVTASSCHKSSGRVTFSGTSFTVS